MKQYLLNILSVNLMLVFIATALGVSAQTRPYRVSDRSVKLTITSIETKTDAFKRELDKALDASRINNTEKEDLVNDYVAEFENATDELRVKFDEKKSVSADVTKVLNMGAGIDRFIKDNNLNYRAKSYWNSVAADLDKLQGYYGLRGNWKIVNSAATSQLPYRVSDSQVQTLIAGIETDTEIYRRSLDRGLDRSTLNGTISEDSVMKFVTDLENATDVLKQKFEARKSVASDVQEVLNRAYVINGFMKDYRLNQRTQRDWESLKTKLATLSTYYNVALNWTNPILVPTNSGNVFNVSEQTLKGTLASIESRTDIFSRDLNVALDRSVLNNSKSEAAILAYVSEFELATDKLKQNFETRRSTADDVSQVLDRAYYINGFMRDYRLQQNAENGWVLIRTDLEKLRDYYGVNFSFTDRQYSPATTFDSMITGTYRLNLNQSDDVSAIVNGVTRSFPVNQKDRIANNLENRLKSPDNLVIEKRNKMVTIASSISPQISFEADGVARDENLPNGRSVKVTANTYYDGVSLNYEGDRINDFYVNFMPANTSQLRVIRRVYLENRNETVTVASVYDKIDQTAQWSTINNGSTSGSNLEDFVVPNNTSITAVLNNSISSKVSQNGDKFTMTIKSPSQYDGATIDGRVASAERSGRVSGRANLSLEFDTIKLRNGKTYRFAGFVQEVKMPNGNSVSVNNEGTVKDSSQTTKTVTRAGIGAALGAIIGAIANGGQGAAIGAAIGAGAGAGTVVLQGRDDIELQEGTEFVLTASAPLSTAVNR